MANTKNTVKKASPKKTTANAVKKVSSKKEVVVKEESPKREVIVARSKNNVIGKNGNIPWKIKGEQRQFRELTTGNVVIMGRKSYEEIGRPLPNRMNIVVSTTTEYQGDNLVSAKSLEDALLLAKGQDVYIAGGYGLFKEALSLVDKMYITEVELIVEDGDTFFPEFDVAEFDVMIGETFGEEVKYTRTYYTRKK